MAWRQRSGRKKNNLLQVKNMARQTWTWEQTAELTQKWMGL